MAAIGTRNLTLSVAAGDVTPQVSNARITSAAADSDFVSFADAAAGGARQYNLEGTAVQDPATGTIWEKIWSAAGTTIAYLLKPYGNAVASAGQPHYSGNVVVQEPDGDFLGGAANRSTTAKFTIDFAWPCDAKPTKVTS
jgi:hypothetical protein